MVWRTELCKDKDLEYSIIANRDGSRKNKDDYDCGYGGSECMRIEAIKFDNHYLLSRVNVLHDFESIPFGIVDIDRRDEVERRLYKEAKKQGEERARFDKNIFVDLTK